MTQNRLTITVVSKEHASDSVHDPAGSLGKEARPRKRRYTSYESDTEALPEYELARLKRIKSNKEMLVSLGIENTLPKLHRRCRKRLPAVPVEDITHLAMTTVSTRSHPSEADGIGEPGSESTTPRPTATFCENCIVKVHHFT